jgi:hypothetical protein
VVNRDILDFKQGVMFIPAFLLWWVIGYS